MARMMTKNFSLSVVFRLLVGLWIINPVLIKDVFSTLNGDEVCESETDYFLRKNQTSFLSESEFLSLDEKGYLYDYAEKYLIHHQPLLEKNLKRLLLLGAQGFCVTVGSLAGAPYFEVGREAGGDNTVLGWAIGITNTLATSGTGAWAFFHLAKGFEPQSSQEKVLVRRGRLPVPVHLTSHALGVAVAVPIGYMMTRYNSEKWLAGLSFVLDYGLKTKGYVSLFKDLKDNKDNITRFWGKNSKKETDLATEAIREALLHHLSNHSLPSVLTKTEKDRDQFIALLEQPENQDVSNYVKSLLSLTHAQNFIQDSPRTWKKGYPRTAFISALSLSAVMNIYHNGYCAYAAWKYLYDNPSFTIPMSAVSVLPTFMLEIQATMKVGGLLYDGAFHRFKGTPQPSLIQTVYPILSKVIPLACVTLGGVTAYVGRFMVIDVLQDSMPDTNYPLFFAVSGFLGPFLFASYANYSLLEDLSLAYARSFGQIRQKKLACLFQDIEKLMNVTRLAPVKDMKKFADQTSLQEILSTKEENPLSQSIDHQKNSESNSLLNKFKCTIL